MMRISADDDIRLLLREAVTNGKVTNVTGKLLPLSSTSKKYHFTDSLDTEDHSRKPLPNVGRDVTSHKTKVLFSLHLHLAGLFILCM